MQFLLFCLAVLFVTLTLQFSSITLHKIKFALRKKKIDKIDKYQSRIKDLYLSLNNDSNSNLNFSDNIDCNISTVVSFKNGKHKVEFEVEVEVGLMSNNCDGDWE